MVQEEGGRGEGGGLHLPLHPDTLSLTSHTLYVNSTDTHRSDICPVWEFKIKTQVQVIKQLQLQQLPKLLSHWTKLK